MPRYVSLSIQLKLITLSQYGADLILFQTIMHFQSSVPTGLRGYSKIQTIGKKSNIYDAANKLQFQNDRRLSLLNLFLSTSAILLLRVLGQATRLPPVLFDGKSFFLSQIKGQSGLMTSVLPTIIVLLCFLVSTNHEQWVLQPYSLCSIQLKPVSPILLNLD